MNKKIVLITLISILLQMCSSSETNPVVNEPDANGRFIDDWTYKIFPKPTDNFEIAEFRLWVPKNVTIKAILILSSSYNSNGLGLVYSPKWQEYAISENLAIISVRLVGRYTNASLGSGNALLRALNELTKKHNITEINNLPFLLRGYSAGGVFSYTFSSFMPNRVIAFSNIRGGSLPDIANNNAFIPALMLVGGMETWRIDRIKQIVLSKRSHGGLWAYAIEPGQGHFGNLTPSDNIIRLFFSKVLSKRVGASNSLNTVLENSGWLGNNLTNEIFSFTTYPNIKNEASWLIDNEFAIEWQNFQ